jgi:hypothetical protein
VTLCLNQHGESFVQRGYSQRLLRFPRFFPRFQGRYLVREIEAGVDHLMVSVVRYTYSPTGAPSGPVAMTGVTVE